jgi:hypothetical protein
MGNKETKKGQLLESSIVNMVERPEMNRKDVSGGVMYVWNRPLLFASFTAECRSLELAPFAAVPS